MTLPSEHILAARLAAIVDSSDDAIIGKDLSGIITSWNAGAEHLYGYEASEVVGRSVALIIPGNRLEELEAVLERIRSGERIEHHETQRLCKDGSVVDISVTISPIRDSRGTIMGASAIGRDITARLSLGRERQMLEARLRQSERLESLGQLAGGIAHDFNNLLAVILNYASCVERELDDEQAVRGDVAQIYSAATRAAALTHQLLSFARREIRHSEVINLNEVIAGLAETLRRTIGEHIELATDPSKDLWCIQADRRQLEQVVTNLVVNARDAMADGGLLTIETNNIAIDEGYAETRPGLAVGRYVRLRISDTGEGMDLAVVEHIFEPFFTTRSVGMGIGLGLSTVFGIVAQASGDIQYHSEVGVGTTCQVLLPATDQLPLTAQPAPALNELEGTETVLVVEDEGALREVIRRILVRNGYHVLLGANGPDALEVVEGYDGVIDLLLTDLMMPKMAGTTLAARLQNLQPGLIVLYMSGYAQAVLGAFASQDGILLEKPFSENQLLTRVRARLGAPA